MAKVKFLATTITSKGTFQKGDEIEVTKEELKGLEPLTSVQVVKAQKPKVKKVEKDDIQE